MKRTFTFSFFIFFGICAFAQINSSCPTINYRNNGNGGTNACPGVGSNPIASNVIGTSYATVPPGNKTGNVRFHWGSITNPPVILAVYQGTTSLASKVGPPSPPLSGITEYCFYDNGTGGGNLPNSGVISFRFSDPQNPSQNYYCAFDFSNNNTGTDLPLIALPLVFMSFTATLQNDNIVGLEWKTIREQNIKEFVIESSIDGINFSAIGILPASGYSNAALSYHFETRQFSSIVYYRIKEVDLNNRISYSLVQQLHIGNQNLLVHVFPNPVPFSKAITIQLNKSFPGGIPATLLNKQGQSVWKGILYQKKQTINFSINPGTYYLKIDGYLQKFVVN